jgi:hypothetical protein
MRFGKNCQYNCRVDVELHIFIEGFNPGLILPMELKNRGLMGIGKCKLKGNTCFFQCPLFLKPLCEITGISSYPIFKRSESKAAWNIGPAVRTTITGIGTGNPWQHLERLCRKRGLDDFAVRDILVEHLGRKLE